MPIWRCPHCGTPQAETARCWVCRRSSTTCSTCRHFRRSLAAQLGYCGLDRRRLPLAGTELRGCWEAGPARVFDAPGDALRGPVLDDDAEPPSPVLRLRDFVPVELARHREARDNRPKRPSTDGPRVQPDDVADIAPATQPAPTWSDRVTLFADAEL